MNPSDLRAPLREAELRELDDFLRSDATGEEALNAEALDGFLTALVSGPEPVMADEWLSVVWDASDDAGVFATSAQRDRIVSLVMRMLNETVHVLMYEPDAFDPMLYALEGESVAGGMDWCGGYLAGMRLRRERWDELVDDPAGFRLLAPILALAVPTTPEIDRSEEETAEKLAALPAAVIAIHHYWQERIAPGASREVRGRR